MENLQIWYSLLCIKYKVDLEKKTSFSSTAIVQILVAVTPMRLDDL